MYASKVNIFFCVSVFMLDGRWNELIILSSRDGFSEDIH